jgi:hypothetical protein
MQTVGVAQHGADNLILFYMDGNLFCVGSRVNGFEDALDDVR